MAIRFRTLGTGSVVPNEDAVQVTERPIQWALTDAVAALLTQQANAIENPSPRDIADLGIPCFRWHGSGRYTDGELEIFPAFGKNWEHLLTWWDDNAVGSAEELENLLKQLRISSGNWPTPTPPWIYDFIYCLPFVAGNVILHRAAEPHRIAATGGSPHLHIFRRWRLKNFSRGLIIGAEFDQASLETIAGWNKLSIFLDRPSQIGTQWGSDPLDPSAAPVAWARSSVPGNLSANLHPWPLPPNDGMVPMRDHNGNRQPVIPLSYTSSLLTYLASPATFGHIFPPAGTGLTAVPYRVTDNAPFETLFDPVTLGESAYTALSAPDTTSGPYLLGKYRNGDGDICVYKVSNAAGTIVAAQNFDSHQETAAGDAAFPTVVLDRLQVVTGGGDMAPGTAWPDGSSALPASQTSDAWAETLPLLRAYKNVAWVPEGAGPELVITIDTGTGGTSAAEHPTAEVQFLCDGWCEISAANENTPELTEDPRFGTNGWKIVVDLTSLLEVDAYGFYLGFQKVILRYRLHMGTIWDTPRNFCLYPLTVSTTGSSDPVPEHPGTYEGFTFTAP